jgi:hypothetical protein
MKGNSHFDIVPSQGFHGDMAPACRHWGKQWRQAGLISTVVAGGNVGKATPADQFQPRLVAGATCLIEAFETFENL